MGIMPGGGRAWVSKRAKGLAKRTGCAVNSLEFTSLLFITSCVPSSNFLDLSVPESLASTK
jgi:hypothetical protein